MINQKNPVRDGVIDGKEDRREGTKNSMRDGLRKVVEELRAGEWRGTKKDNKKLWLGLLEGDLIPLIDLDTWDHESELDNNIRIEVQNEVLKKLKVTREEVEAFLEKIPDDREIRRESRGRSIR